jgi:hypothetical protein
MDVVWRIEEVILFGQPFVNHKVVKSRNGNHHGFGSAKLPSAVSSLQNPKLPCHSAKGHFNSDSALRRKVVECVVFWNHVLTGWISRIANHHKAFGKFSTSFSDYGQLIQFQKMRSH